VRAPQRRETGAQAQNTITPMFQIADAVKRRWFGAR